MIHDRLVVANDTTLAFMMLLTVKLSDKKAYIYKLFKELWKNTCVECQICFELIKDDGVIVVSSHQTLNLEKMFHSACLARWWTTTSTRRDPFNRQVKSTFNFPPKTLDECCALLNSVKGFIGEERADIMYSREFKRVHAQNLLDIEVNFESLLRYKR